MINHISFSRAKILSLVTIILMSAIGIKLGYSCLFLYNKLSSLPDYSKIQYAVEYSIYNLCALTLNTCLNLGQAAPTSIQKQRLNTINYYLNNYIKLPITDNKYIQNKMSSKDINLINNIDSIISRLG